VNRYRCILLIGPTGSGKTPLGNLLEKNGLNGKKCWHFDFGANLRAIAGQRPGARFSLEEISFIKNKLCLGTLLEDKDSPLAQKILDEFIVSYGVSQNDLIVLNGLPRHIGQAKAMAGIMDIDLIVSLSTTPEVIRERIRNNIDGDRTFRTDDSLDEIIKKLELFKERTQPLLDYYRQEGVEIKTINIDSGTKATDIWQELKHGLIK